jgi:tetraacyldisaccharide 4'-kinase
VADFVERLIRLNKTPAILSRGYRALDDRGNDEKRILDRLCPGVSHYQQPDRVASAKLAVAGGANVLVLDDGFQHRRLMRDLDVVVIDATQPWGYGHLLPRGLLRESLAGLRRAQLVILSRVDLADQDTLRDIHRVVGRHITTDRIAEVAFTPRRWLEQHGSIRSLEELRNVPSVAFCGIGNPAAFERTVHPLVDVRATRVFPDHYHYTAEDGSALARLARENGAQMLVTTLKDLVKLPTDFCPTELPLVALDIAAEYRAGEEVVDQAIAGVFTKSPTETQQNQPSHTR